MILTILDYHESIRRQGQKKVDADIYHIKNELARVKYALLLLSEC